MTRHQCHVMVLKYLDDNWTYLCEGIITAAYHLRVVQSSVYTLSIAATKTLLNMIQIECSDTTESSITAKDAADVLDKCRIELKRGVQIPSNANLLKYRNEFVAFCKRKDSDDGYHELCSLVDEIKQLEERKSLLLSKRDDLKSLPSKRDYVSNESELEHIITRLSANEKRFCTKLLRHPLIVANIEKLDTTCRDFANVLASTIQEIRANGTCQVYQDNANKNNGGYNSFRRRAEEMASKAKVARTLVSELQETLRIEREEHDGRVCELDRALRRVAENVKGVLDGTDGDSIKNRRAMNSKVSAARSDAEQKEVALRTDIDKLERLVQKAARDHQRRVSQIKSDIEALETKGAAQHELAAKEDAAEAQMQSLIAKREENLKSLVELQRRWDKDEAEKKRLNDKREEERRKELQLQKEDEYRRLCAKKISVAYRIYLRKKAKVAAAQKGKRGKKGAKGKKKRSS